MIPPVWIRIPGALCLILLFVVFPANAQEELDRLFFTPEEREALDQQRQFRGGKREEMIGELAPVLSIDGVVIRSNGQRTLWINGTAQEDAPDRGLDRGITLVPSRTRPGQVTVLTGDGTDTSARVGDTINRNTGEASNPLGDGSLRVKTAKQPVR